MIIKHKPQTIKPQPWNLVRWSLSNWAILVTFFSPFKRQKLFFQFWWTVHAGGKKQFSCHFWSKPFHWLISSNNIASNFAWLARVTYRDNMSERREQRDALWSPFSDSCLHTFMKKGDILVQKRLGRFPKGDSNHPTNQSSKMSP